MKSYTDLDQSKKLAEILPLESADMYYDKHYLENYYCPIPLIGKYSEIHDQIPCWSLTALLSVIPKDEYKDVDLCFGGYQGDNYIDEWFCSYEQHNHPFFIETCHAPTPVDACYEMIIKLKENNKL